MLMVIHDESAINEHFNVQFTNDKHVHNINTIDHN